jgi:hypothetical protein
MCIKAARLREKNKKSVPAYLMTIIHNGDKYLLTNVRNVTSPDWNLWHVRREIIHKTLGVFVEKK